MQAATLTPALPRRIPRLGVIVSTVPVLFLLFDTVIKLVTIQPVVDSFTQLGWPVELAFGIGLLQLLCLTCYVVPRTSVLGAVLLTGYLGGAVATHVRIGSPLLTHTLFPVYVAALLWIGLAMREQRLRAVLPLIRGRPRSDSSTSPRRR